MTVERERRCSECRAIMGFEEVELGGDRMIDLECYEDTCEECKTAALDEPLEPEAGPGDDS